MVRGKVPSHRFFFLVISMKLFILIVLLQFVTLFSASGQTQPGPDSVGVSVRTLDEASHRPSEKPSQVVEKKKKQDAEKTNLKHAQPADIPLKGFIDENGDGIDDRLATAKGKVQGQRHMGQMQHDRFIDNDGDGINDERCGGMGIAPKKEEHNHGKHH